MRQLCLLGCVLRAHSQGRRFGRYTNVSANAATQMRSMIAPAMSTAASIDCADPLGNGATR
jgi:hypothetical protein